MNVRSPLLVCEAFEAAPDALYVVAPDGLVLEANRAAFALLERDPESTLGRPFDEVAAPRLGPLGRLLLAAQQPDDLAREIAANGRWLRASASALRGPDGEAHGTVLGLTDVTAPRAARAELEQRHHAADAASRLKDEFLATLSHELRTPLNAVLGWLHLLQTGAIEEASRARALETVARNARQQARLVDDVLDVARISAGKLRLQIGELRFDDLVRATAESLRPTAEAKGVSWHVRVAGDLPPLLGDAERLEQVVGNLLSNSIKFTPRGGRIDLTLSPDGPWLALVVRDDGAGIAPAFLPHVFDRFRQQDGSPTREHKGLGLGLSLVHHFVELHGGEVRAESEGEGRGATFTVRLPRLPLHAQPNAPPSPRPTSSPLLRFS